MKHLLLSVFFFLNYQTFSMEKDEIPPSFYNLEDDFIKYIKQKKLTLSKFDEFLAKGLNIKVVEKKIALISALLHCDKWNILIPKAIKNGANINLQDSNGLTPLNYAVQNYLYAPAKFLLNCGANPMIAEFSKNNTPLHIICQTYLLGVWGPQSNRAWETFYSLLFHGADPGVQNKEGDSVLYLFYNKSSVTNKELYAAKVLLCQSNRSSIMRLKFKEIINIKLVKLIKQFAELDQFLPDEENVAPNLLKNEEIIKIHKIAQKENLPKPNWLQIQYRKINEVQQNKKESCSVQ